MIQALKNKALKEDIARLLREATIRIDNEQHYLAEIVELETKIDSQRRQIRDSDDR